MEASKTYAVIAIIVALLSLAFTLVIIMIVKSQVITIPRDLPIGERSEEPEIVSIESPETQEINILPLSDLYNKQLESVRNSRG